ncbi:MAG TPA: hypothetical protein DHW14_02525 [Clostridiales bacterium]|nr:hypothetical protein [Clostridiales bacterium]
MRRLRLLERLVPGMEGRRAAALLVLGYLGGLVMGVALLSARLDRVSLEREQLLVKNRDLEIQVERLQERLSAAESGGSGPLVKRVTLDMRGLDELSRLRVESALSDLLDDLVGEPVAGLDPALVFHLLDGRRVAVEGMHVVLHVRGVVLAPETRFWIDLEALPEESPEKSG